jgi:hypothetical protein
VSESVDLLLRELRQHRISYGSETELGRSVVQLLAPLGIEYVQEYRLSAGSRVDLFLDGGVAVELKVGGAPTSVLRQLHRYAEHDIVRELLLITTRHAHLRGLPAQLCGKPVYVFRVTSL